MGALTTVKEIYEAFGRQDIPAILERLAADVEWEWETVDHGVPWLKPRRGRADVAGFFATLGAVEFQRFELMAMLEGDHQVVAMLREELLVKATGKVIKDVAIHHWTLGPGGQVTRLRHFVDTHQHLQALK